MTDPTNLTIRDATALVSQIFRMPAPKGMEEFYSSLVFSGDTMYASTHEVGVSVPFTTPFTGGIDGRVLLAIMDTFDEKDDISLVEENGLVRITCGGSTATLPLKVQESQMVLLPEATLSGDAETFLLSKEDTSILLKAMQRASVSVDPDDPRPSLRGINFHTDGQCNLYTCDAVTISKVPVHTETKLDIDGIIVPAALVDLLSNTASKIKTGCELVKAQDYFQIRFGDKVVIQAGLIEGDGAFNLPGVFVEHTSRLAGVKETGMPAPLSPIPGTLAKVIDASKITLVTSIAEYARVAVSDGVVSVSSGDENLRGLLKSAPLTLEGAPDVVVKVSPARVSKILASGANKVLFDQSLVYFYNDTDGSQTALSIFTDRG